MSYASFQKTNAPTWLQDIVGASWLGGLGTTKDYVVDLLRQAVLARFPSYGPVDALGHIGADRVLPQGVTEGVTDYAARLKDAWNAWARAGSPLAMLVALHYAGFDNAVTIQQNGRACQLTLPLPAPPADPSPNLVIAELGQLSVALTSDVTPGRSIPAGTPWATFDSDTDYASRFVIIFEDAYDAVGSYRYTVRFRNTDYVDLTWPTPFANGDYKLIKGGLQTADDFVKIRFTNPTTAGVRVEASAAFTGSVDVMAFRDGVDPLVDPADEWIESVREIVDTWRPGKAKPLAVTWLVQGAMRGWPVRKWGERGGKMGGSIAKVYRL